MYARVARWEGADPQALREMVDQMRKDAAAGAGPPGDVPAVGGTVLVDFDQARSMAVMLFDTEEDRARAHEVLDAMTPPRDTGGRRVSVEFFEVALDIRAPDRASTMG